MTETLNPIQPENESLGFLLADTMRLTRRVAAQYFEQHQLTLSQAKALMRVSRCQGIRQVDLAEALEIQPITLARLVDQLSASGLIERRPDPADRRAYQLFLTPAAEPTLVLIREASAELQKHALMGLSKEQVDTLFFALNTACNNLSTLTR